MKKTKTSRTFKCWKCSVFFYIVLYCITGLALGVFACFMLLIRHDVGHILGPKRGVIYFLILPTVLTILSTIVGWRAIKRKNIALVKCFAVLVALTSILEIAGSIWCFASQQDTYRHVSLEMGRRFSSKTTTTVNENWWNDIQKKLKCCGLHGPSDYREDQVVPFSCCGSDPQSSTKGVCSVIWQDGCSDALATKLSQDFVFLSLAAVLAGLLQIPGVFISWCFANRISRDVI